MLTNGQETFYFEMNKHACSYTMYFPMVFDKYFNLEVFKESAGYLMQQIPHLQCRCKDQFWRVRWVKLDDFCVDNLFCTYTLNCNHGVSQEEFYAKAMDKFMSLEDKQIEMDKEPQLKFKVFLEKCGNWSMVVICFHHSIADGRGSLQIISSIEQTYSAIINNKEKPKLKNYRKIPFYMLKENIFKVLIRTFTKKDHPLASRNSIDLIDSSNETYRNENFEVLRISKEKMQQLKDFYSEWGYSTNDIIVHKFLVLSAKLLNEKAANDNAVLNVGIAVDNRKNINKDILTITNYASMCPFYIEEKNIYDKAVVKAELQEFKKTASGLSFSKEFILLALFPYAVQKKVFECNVKTMIKEMSSKGIQTTNVGEITRYVGTFNDSLKYVEFIGPAGRNGMPIISISVYDGQVTLYFRRTNDSTGICQKVKELFIEELEHKF